MNSAVSFLVAAAVAVTSAATSFVPAQALPRVAPIAAQDGSGADVQQVSHRRAHRGHRSRGARHHVRRYPRYHRQHVRRYPRYHRRHYYSHGHHHHHHYGSSVGLGITLGVVGAVVGSGYYGGLSWHEACARKYRSFNWNTGLFLGYDGYWHPCVLP